MYNRIQIQNFSDTAIDSIKSHKLKPTPDNYRLWYEYATGELEELSVAIDAMAEAGNILSETSAQSLYLHHIANEEQRKLDATHKGLTKVLSSIAEKITSFGETAMMTSEALQELCIKLKKNPNPKMIEEIINHATQQIEVGINVTKKIHKSTERMQREISELREGMNRLSDQALTDSLTGIHNRRFFDNVLEEMISSSKKPFCLLLIDIDYFKKINDNFGHQTGDKVLRYIATMLKNVLRGNDIVTRYGGEEFGIILPESAIENAKKIANDLRQSISSKPLTRSSDKTNIGQITVSIGISQFNKQDDQRSLVKRADDCLYEAKQGGRNCVVSESCEGRKNDNKNKNAERFIYRYGVMKCQGWRE